MATYVNDSGIIYAVLQGFTVNVTGAWYFTFAAILVLVIVLALAFRIPVEFTAVIILPLALVMAAFSVESGGNFMGILGVVLAYLGILLAKYFLFR